MLATPAETLPLVSIVVPAYNHEKFITACLDSVQADPYPRKELIILDDGSRDQTLALAQEWCRLNQAGFARVDLSSQPNQGVCATLNRLVGRAEGECIVLLASDDELAPGGILKRVSYLLDHPEALAVYGDSWLMDAQGRTIGPSLIQGLGIPGNKAALQDPSLIALELVLRWSGCGPGLMLRRICFDPAAGLGLFDESLYFEDREYFLRMVSRGKLGFIDDQVARYRVLETSMCRSRENALKMEQGMLLSEQRNRHAFRGMARAALEASILQRRLRIKGAFWKQLRFLPANLIIRPLKLALDLRARHARKP